MAGLERVVAVVLDPADDVATVLKEARPGTSVLLRHGASGEVVDEGIVATAVIPFGHKVARRALDAGRPLRRYGQPIGIATRAIAPGDHVHSHNLRSRLSPAGAAAEAAPVVRPAAWIRDAVSGCALAAGASPAAAADLADALVEAHLRGVETHGLRRLPPLIGRIRAGGIAAAAEPVLELDGALVRVDGRNGLGHHVATVAADAAGRAANAHGVGLALVRDSTHFGFAGHYAARLAAKGMLAIVSSNGQVMVGPPGARRPLFSNDPVAIAAPMGDGRFMELDMALSVTSRANIAAAAERGQGIAAGIALGADGRPTEDAQAALAGVLLPFGGAKGFALLFAIEALTGVLSGGAYADRVASKEAAPGAPEGTAHVVIAISIAHALGVEAFQDRLRDMAARLAALPMADGEASPRYPGQRRWALRAKRLAEGVPLAAAEVAAVERLANSLGVTLP